MSSTNLMNPLSNKSYNLEHLVFLLILDVLTQERPTNNTI
jgi:hypothetical protein